MQASNSVDCGESFLPSTQAIIMKHLDYLLCALSLTFPYYGLSAGYPGVSIRNQLDQTTFGVDEPGTSTDVDLGYAIYRGSYNATVDRTDFLGVRYASPPIGIFLLPKCSIVFC